MRCFALSTLARRAFDDGPGALIGSALARTVAGGLRNPNGVASDASDASGVYRIASGIGSSGLAGSLSHAPLEPNGAITVMIQDINLVYALAADTTHVYVASVGQMIADGQIVRIK